MAGRRCTFNPTRCFNPTRLTSRHKTVRHEHVRRRTINFYQVPNTTLSRASLDPRLYPHFSAKSRKLRRGRMRHNTAIAIAFASFISLSTAAWSQTATRPAPASPPKYSPPPRISITMPPPPGPKFEPPSRIAPSSPPPNRAGCCEPQGPDTPPPPPPAVPEAPPAVE